MTQGGMDGHSMEIVKGVNLCTSLIFTSGSRTEGPQKGRELWFERSPTPTNNAESTKMHHLKISTLAECKYGRQELTVRVRNKQRTTLRKLSSRGRIMENNAGGKKG